MAYSVKDDVLVEELLKSIQTTTSLIQTLMSDIKENASALATLEIKLESLSDSAKTLSKIVRDDNGNKSVLTRIAILENDLGDMLINYKEFKVLMYKKMEDANSKINKIENTNHSETENIQEIKKILKKINPSEGKSRKTKLMLAGLQISPGILALILVMIKIIWHVDIGL